MARYEVYVFCNSCSDVHPMDIRLSLNDGPAEKDSIHNTYAGKALPPSVVTLRNNTTFCPNTGMPFVQEDNNQIFLVAIGD